MDSCRKYVLASLKTLVLAVLLVAAAFTHYLYIGGFDDVAGLSLDDADLIVELDDVPDDENAFLTFMSATNYYSVASDWRIELNLDSSVECLTQRRREAESAENARNLANTMNYASNLLEAKQG